jgi:hypothetical protein
MSSEVLLEDLFSPELMDGLDINRAFHEAAEGVMTNEEMALDDKVARMEHIIQEASSDFYQEFVDLRSMAAQIEMFCNHDHSIQDALQGSEQIGAFMDRHAGHTHEHGTLAQKQKVTEERKKNAKKKHKKIKQLSGWALLGITQKTS